MRPVDAAFRLGRPGPTPGARVTRSAALFGAGLAADREITDLGQGMAGQIVGRHIELDVERAETSQRFCPDPIAIDR